MPKTPPETVFKGPRGPLRHRCAEPSCASGCDQLRRCAGCNIVRYCGRDHQVLHRPQHKSLCNKTKKARDKLAKEDTKIHEEPGDGFATPANAFETSVGRFWQILSTRDYMRARFSVVELARGAATLDGAEEALNHMADMLRLCKSDNMGLRYIVPALMLRLDRDQECYDFINWWYNDDRNSEETYHDAIRSPVNDVLKSIPMGCTGKWANTTTVATLLLLKLKLLVDLRNLKVTRKVLPSTPLPPELYEPIEKGVLRSPISQQLIKQTNKELLETEAQLRKQTSLLGGALFNANDNFMHGLFDAEAALGELPGPYSFGSYEEMVLAMHYTFATWWETTGVLELLQLSRLAAALSSADEMEDMMTGERFKNGPGSDRTREELLDDVSTNRLWGYFDWALHDYSYLGNWDERPSERERKICKEAAERAIAEEAEEEDDEWECYGEDDDDAGSSDDL